MDHHAKHHRQQQPSVGGQSLPLHWQPSDAAGSGRAVLPDFSDRRDEPVRGVEASFLFFGRPSRHTHTAQGHVSLLATAPWPTPNTACVRNASCRKPFVPTTASLSFGNYFGTNRLGRVLHRPFEPARQTRT